MWKLMSDLAVSSEDRQAMADFILTQSRLTKHTDFGRGKVYEFEQAWSDWLGCKYSVFVNSGSSANLLIADVVKDMYGKGTWVCQSVTWSTNISPVLQLGNDLALCDVSLANFGPDLSSLERLFETIELRPIVLFLTHVIGFPALSQQLFDLCEKYNVILLEDCCESHGAVFRQKKVGTFGKMSSFSFYYGHHMTTIEGGMVCTDDEDVYHRLLLKRSHGLLKELPKDIQKEKQVDSIDPLFTFLSTGYNLRNTEVYALLGLRQLSKLDESIQIRNKNFDIFISALDPELYITDFSREGLSSFCLPIVCRDENNVSKAKQLLSRLGIEYRPLISGNLNRQPFLAKVQYKKHDIMADHLHKCAIYAGNNQFIPQQSIVEAAQSLNAIR